MEKSIVVKEIAGKGVSVDIKSDVVTAVAMVAVSIMEIGKMAGIKPDVVLGLVERILDLLKEEITMSEVSKDLAVLDATNIDKLVDGMTYDVIKSSEFGEAYEALKSATERLAEQKKKIDDKLKEVLKQKYLEDGTTKIEVENMRFNFIAGSVREGFDKDKLKEEHPRIYAKYVTKTICADSVKASYIKKK